MEDKLRFRDLANTWGFPAKSPSYTRVAANNLLVDAKSMCMNEIRMKADGGPEWPTSKETRANISLPNPR